MKLTEDIHSFVRPSVVYGRRGEEVKLIATHGNVLIVESTLSLNRFPVSVQKITTEAVEQSPVVETSIIHPVVSRPAKKRKSKPAPPPQSTLLL